MIRCLARSSSTNRNSRSTTGTASANDFSERSRMLSMWPRSAGRLTVSRCSATARTWSTSSRYDWRIRNMVATSPTVPRPRAESVIRAGLRLAPEHIDLDPELLQPAIDLGPPDAERLADRQNVALVQGQQAD